MELKEKQLQLNQESYNKYMYALKLRMEAAEHIGIENIRRSRLAKLEKEKATIESEHKKRPIVSRFPLDAGSQIEA